MRIRTQVNCFVIRAALASYLCSKGLCYRNFCGINLLLNLRNFAKDQEESWHNFFWSWRMPDVFIGWAGRQRSVVSRFLPLGECWSGQWEKVTVLLFRHCKQSIATSKVHYGHKWLFYHVKFWSQGVLLTGNLEISMSGKTSKTRFYKLLAAAKVFLVLK